MNYMTEKVFFDTNILVYSYFVQSEEKSVKSRKLIIEGGSISSQVIAETCFVLLKKGNYSEDEIRTVVRECYSSFNVISHTENIFLIAADLRKKYKFSYWDSLIIASAKHEGCNILYSEDLQHNFNADSLKIVNPFV
jgi:predicted nucleic acid-binding protein